MWHLELPPKAEEKRTGTEPEQFQAFRQARNTHTKATQAKTSAEKAFEKAKTSLEAAQKKFDEAAAAEKQAEQDLSEVKRTYWESYPEQAQNRTDRDRAARAAAEAMPEEVPGRGSVRPATEAPATLEEGRAAGDEGEPDDDPMGFNERNVRQRQGPAEEEDGMHTAGGTTLVIAPVGEGGEGLHTATGGSAGGASPASPPAGQGQGDRQERSRSPNTRTPLRDPNAPITPGLEGNSRLDIPRETGPPDGWDCPTLRSEYAGGGWGSP